MEDVDINWHICKGPGVCIYCGRTLMNNNILGVEELDALDNNTLQQQGRNVHGALYKRINTLQRDLNILRETNKKQRSYIQELEATNRDLSTIQTRPTRVTVQFPNESDVIYKLVRE